MSGRGAAMDARWLQRLAFRFGYQLTLRKLPQYEVRRKTLGIPRDMEPEFVELYRRTCEYTLTSVERMYALYQAVRHVVAHEVPGDLVECGVWRGGSCMLMAGTLLACGDTSRRIVLYDTFAGMTRPSERDVRTADGSPQLPRWEAFRRQGYNAWCYASVEEVWANMRSTGYPADRIELVAGEVEHTLPARAPRQLALLRLDTDWYESTYHELRHLYPRLAPHGALIVDDYGAYAGAREAVDRYLREQGMVMYLHRIDTAGRIGIKGG